MIKLTSVKIMLHIYTFGRAYSETSQRDTDAHSAGTELHATGSCRLVNKERIILQLHVRSFTQTLSLIKCNF